MMLYLVMAYKNKEDQAAAANRHYIANKEKMIERAANHKKALREEIRLHLQNLKSKTKCADCNLNYPYYVMQFDHVGEAKRSLT